MESGKTIVWKNNLGIHVGEIHHYTKEGYAVWAGNEMFHAWTDNILFIGSGDEASKFIRRCYG